MFQLDKEYIRKMYFHSIATLIARKSPERIKRERLQVELPEDQAFNLAASFVANYLYNHKMDMSLFISSIETMGYIPRRGLPVKIARDVDFNERKDMFIQLIKRGRPRNLEHLSEGKVKSDKRKSRAPDMDNNYDNKESKHRHHRHHKHRDYKESSTLGSEITPSVAYRNTAKAMLKRASCEIQNLGIDPDDPDAAEKIYKEFKQFMIERKLKEELSMANSVKVPQSPQQVIAEQQMLLQDMYNKEAASIKSKSGTATPKAFMKTASMKSPDAMSAKAEEEEEEEEEEDKSDNKDIEAEEDNKDIEEEEEEEAGEEEEEQ